MDIKCPECNADISISKSHLEQSSFCMTCDNCGTQITFKNDLPDALKKIENDIGAMLDNAFKGNKHIKLKL